MPCPWTPEELAEKLREADPERTVWTTDAECLDAARQAIGKYRPDPAHRPLDVGRLAEKGRPGVLFVVIRAELEVPRPVGLDHLQFITLAQGDRRHLVYENPSSTKAAAVAKAINELEADL